MQSAMQRAKWTLGRQNMQFDTGRQRGIVTEYSAESFCEGPEQRRRELRQGIQRQDASGAELDGCPHRQRIQQAAVDIPAAVDALR